MLPLVRKRNKWTEALLAPMYGSAASLGQAFVRIFGRCSPAEASMVPVGAMGSVLSQYSDPVSFVFGCHIVSLPVLLQKKEGSTFFRARPLESLLFVCTAFSVRLASSSKALLRESCNPTRRVGLRASGFSSVEKAIFRCLCVSRAASPVISSVPSTENLLVFLCTYWQAYTCIRGYMYSRFHGAHEQSSEYLH